MDYPQPNGEQVLGRKEISGSEKDKEATTVFFLPESSLNQSTHT